MSSAVFVIPFRFVVSPPVAGYLPPPYGTRQGALMSDFLRSTSRLPGTPNAHVPGRWHERYGTGRRRLAASAFGTDNNAWSAVRPRRVRRSFRAIALACCQMLIGVCAAISMLGIMFADSAIRHPMVWDSAQSAYAPSMVIRQTPMQSVHQIIGTVPAPAAARSVPVVHVVHPAPAVPAAKRAARGTKSVSTPMARRIVHRPPSVKAKSGKPAPIMATKSRKPAPTHHTRQHGPMKLATHRSISSVKRARKSDDWASNDAIRALRDELARQDAVARTHAVASARVPANAVFLLHDQVRLTER
ncbi:hypothetical protein [Burkholderia sp. 3C]